MVLLIGKQIDSSFKRLDVMEYIGEQSELISLYANVMHEVQKESALSVGYLSGMNVLPMKLDVQYARTDGAVSTLDVPIGSTDLRIREGKPFDGLNILPVLADGVEVAITLPLAGSRA